MRSVIIAIVTVLLIAGIAIEYEAKHHHSDAALKSQSGTVSTTTNGSGDHVTVHIPFISSTAHDACSDLTDTEVKQTAAPGESDTVVIHSTVDVDPAWRTLPEYFGCLWGVYSKKNPTDSDNLELLVGAFQSGQAANTFYRAQIGSPVPRGMSTLKLSIPTSKGVFSPQSSGHSGGYLLVLRGNTTLRLTSLTRSTSLSKTRALDLLKAAATDVLAHHTLGTTTPTKSAAKSDHPKS